MLDSLDELLHNIRLGEDTRLELKTVNFKGKSVSSPRREDLADEMAAIANTADGIIVFGVDDKTREIVGIPLEQLDIVERYVYEICTDSIRPAIFFKTFRLDLPDTQGISRNILKVEIPRSLFVHESPGGYFHRLGSSKRKMPPEVLARLFQQRSQARLIRFEEQAVPGTGFSDLSPGLWQRFLGAKQTEPVDTLGKMRLLTADESGVERATVAGILLCSDTPERWLPGAFIEAVHYRGKQRDSNYQLDAAHISGPLDKQIQDALAFVRRNMRVAARKDPGRMEFPQYSIRAVFEAIVNAVAHRDYSIHGSKIRLFMFDDRLEIFSPGNLPNTVTIDNIGLRQATRNELITFLLSRLMVKDHNDETGRQFFMEKRGEGVPIIFEESWKISNRQPLYHLIDNAELLLTIYSAEKP
jgi:predicted HTH transcriptional regulator